MDQSPVELSDLPSSSPSDGLEVKRTEMICGEVRTTSNLSGVDAVAKSVGVGCDNSRTSLTAQQRPKLCQGSLHSTSREHQPSLVSSRRLTVPLPGSGHFHPARRTATFTSYPPLHSTVIHNIHRQRKVRQERHSTSAMDYVPSPETFCTPDILKSTFSASPSSLYMYDPEHPDMHTALHTTRTQLGPICTAPELTTLTPVESEFDLHPQYENSNNLEGFFGEALGSNIMPAGACEASVGGQAGGKREMGLVDVYHQDLNKLKPGPVITDVNMDPYLFEDVDAIVISEGAKLPRGTSLPPQKQVDVKTENFSHIQPDSGPKTFTPLKSVKTSQSPAAVVQMLHQSQSSSSPTSTTSLTQLLTRNRTPNVAIVSPIPTTSPVTTNTIIKTEPSDMDKTMGNPAFHKMVASPPQQNSRVSPPVISQSPSPPGGRLVMQVVGQSRPPTLGQQGKSGSVEEKWKEIEKFIHDPNGEQAEASTKDKKRKRHASGASTVSDEESVKSQRVESISDDDFDSDDDSDMSDTPFEESLTELAKKSKQYFWQYNIQAKGPKGTRLPLNISDTDPHHPSNFEDPVFDVTNTSLVGIRHGGKARKGDGNEITPNPRKLYQIGQRLCRLNREINNVQLASHLPASVRSKSRKEKNKLSSRACRLKKKAQHEANKIKLFGLNCQQGELLEVIRLVWPCLKERAKQQMKENVPSSLSSDTLSHQINNIVTTHCKTTIAGNTADYVNQVIARVEEGDPVGGLAIKLKVKK